MNIKSVLEGQYVNKLAGIAKKQCLKNEIIKNIETIIDTAEKRDSLDFFNIEISNHQGKLNIEYKLKNRKKVY